MNPAQFQALREMEPDRIKAYWKKHAYVEELPDNIGPFKQLLQEYSKVPAEEVDELLHRTRDDLWNVVKYPCIGRWGFTNLHTASNSRFDAALKRLLSTGGANEDAILDIGCCVGQVLRHFAYKGVDPARLFGTDLHPEFIGIGDELFKDKGRGPTFVAGDMLDADDEPLKALDGKVTMVQAANFFHLFTWDDQVKIGSRIIRFLKPGTTDAVIFGRQIGTIKPRAIEVLQGRYLHDQSSFQRLWDEIGEETGTKWRVEAEVIEGVPVTLPVFGEDERYIRFGVYQVSPPAIP